MSVHSLSPAEAANLLNNGNGTVTDNSTGLVWQQDEPGAMTWGDALSYCEGLSLGGNSDWRLPNVRELESLTDDERYNPAIDTSFFPNTYASRYWASTTLAGNPDITWYVNFGDDSIYDGSKGDVHVRCVRSGQSGSLGNLTIHFSGSGAGMASGNGVRMGDPVSFSTNTAASELFDEGTTVNIIVEPSEYSRFTGWTGACGDASDCGLAMTSSVDVIANFDFDNVHKARIGDTTKYFTTLQAASNAAVTGNTVDAWGTGFNETVTLASSQAVTIKGGFNEAYSANDGYTTLQGSLTVRNGSLTVERLVIR
jgi:hypothetical protein